MEKICISFGGNRQMSRSVLRAIDCLLPSSTTPIITAMMPVSVPVLGFIPLVIVSSVRRRTMVTMMTRSVSGILSAGTAVLGLAIAVTIGMPVPVLVRALVTSDRAM